VAKHYGAIIRPCPSRRGNRKGSVEAAVRYACGRWWRTLDVRTMAEAQASLDRFCATVADARPRGGSTVGALAASEALRALPLLPYPATLTRIGLLVDADATVAFDGTRYSVPPGFIGARVTAHHRLGSPTLEIVSATGIPIAVHRVSAGGGIVRTPEHRIALEREVLAAFSTARPCERKGNHPPGPAARTAAALLRGGTADREVVVDLARYAELVEAAR
jgi:hypothetical protein